METETVTISKEKYLKLKKECKVDIELVEKVKRSLEDIKKGKIREWI